MGGFFDYLRMLLGWWSSPPAAETPPVECPEWAVPGPVRAWSAPTRPREWPVPGPARDWSANP